MGILVLESDPAQVETIRHIVCNVLATELTLVHSVDDALEALRVATPDLVLLSALVPPAEEAKLVTMLREHPEGAHVETLFTPVISRKEENARTSTRGWFRWPRRRKASDAPSADETTLFTERLTQSLLTARERRQQDEERRTAFDRVDERDAPDGVVSLPGQEIEDEVATEASIPNRTEAPVAPSPASHEDRRTHRRFHAHELQALRTSRVAGGPAVNVRDVSAGGVLLESDTPLEYDFGVLELVTGLLHARYVPFRVIRRQVETHGTQTRHVDACAFLEPLDVSDLRGPESRTDTDVEGLAELRSILDSFLTGPSAAERRRHVRVAGPFGGCRRGPIDWPIVIHNLSQGGCFVDSRLEADPGRSLVIGLRTVDGDWIDVAGEVVHNQPGIGFAVRFVEVSDATRDGLARIVAERAAGVDARDRR